MRDITMRMARRSMALSWMTAQTGSMTAVAVMTAFAAATPLTAGATTAEHLRVEVVAERLNHPWGMAFIGDGKMLVTERPGAMRVVTPDGVVGPPLAGVPPVDAGGQGGMLDVITDSNFQKNRTIYFCYSEAARPGLNEEGNGTVMASARLSEESTYLDQVKVLFRQQPKVVSRGHFGCRIVESPDGTLFLTLGERFVRMDDAQNLSNHLGKVVRVAKDGSVPKDNPFVGRKDAMPEIWSYGHRNMQGAAWGPDKRLWTIEHGPQGGDELNHPQAGKNYGWPVITYGEQYGGGPIGEGITQRAGMEQPVHYWVPSIAPSGLTFVNSNRYGPQMQGRALVGSLKFRYLARLTLHNGKVVKEEKLLEDLRQRVRDVAQGPDGYVYLLTDHGRGQLLRLRSDP